MRNVRRQRHYVGRHWLVMMKPVLRYSHTREAFVLRGVGSSVGPVLRLDRRRATRTVEGTERRAAPVA
jgi:hypothetical protein